MARYGVLGCGRTAESESRKIKNPRLPRERESKIQRSIIVRLDRLGIQLWRRNVGALRRTDKTGKIRLIRFNRAGQADLWGVSDIDNSVISPESIREAGLLWVLHWEIETKRLNERPTPLQLAWLKTMTMRGCVAFWVDNANVAERVAEAVLAGGRIVWHQDDNYDVEVPNQESSLWPFGERP